MKDFTKEELTVDDLKSMNPGVFAQGTCKNSHDDIFMVDSRIGDNMLWVAVRGVYHDWAIYIHWEENGIEYVKDFGDKILQLVKVPLNQNQFDALVSICYNIGMGNFSKSTLLKKINQGDFKGASLEFEKWNKSGGIVLAGLVKRRLKEKALFIS